MLARFITVVEWIALLSVLAVVLARWGDRR